MPSTTHTLPSPPPPPPTAPDPRRLPDERREAAAGWYASCVPMAHRMASEFVRRNPGVLTFDEAHEAALEGLENAVFRFKPELGFRFTTYSYYAVRTSLTRAATVARRRCREVSFDTLPCTPDGSQISLDNPPPALASQLSCHDDCDVEAADHYAAVRDRLIGQLSERHWQALLWRYVEERSLTEIGAELGITKEGARQLALAALRRAREVFNPSPPKPPRSAPPRPRPARKPTAPSASLCSTLEFIRRAGETRAATVAAHAGIGATAAHHRLTRLLTAGYVTRRRVPGGWVYRATRKVGEP